MYLHDLSCVVFSLIIVAHTTTVRDWQHVRRQNGPVPPGTIKDCTYFYDSQAGDTCATIATAWGITLQQFTTYNPSVKSDCSGLVIGNSYCVEENNGKGPESTSSILTTTTSPSSTVPSNSIPTTSAGPLPTQTGISSQCTQYYKVKPGDTCAAIVNTYHTFSLEDFYSWNPAVGSNCETLYVGYYVCVGVPGTPTTPATTSTAAATPTGPSPTQSGLVSNCSDYYKVQSGDYCAKIVSSYGTFTLESFYAWNPSIGTNCGSLFVGYYVCVGVPGTPTTRPSSVPTTTSSGATGPSPTQSGIISTCTKYYQAVSGDSCRLIADRLGTFSVADFEAWNPAVQNDCSQLFLGYYYCVAVPGTPTAPSSITVSASPTGASGPQPQQPGIVRDCNRFYQVRSGDGCYAIEQRQGVSSADFLTWNAGIMSDCSNLWVGYYVCTGVALG